MAVIAALGTSASGCAVGGGQNLGVSPYKPEVDLLSAQELQVGCPGLKAALAAHATDIKTYQAQMAAELSKPAPNLQRMAQRSSGAEGGGTVAFDKIKLERRMLIALQARMNDKKCPAVSIERVLADAPAPTVKSCPDDFKAKFGKSKPTATTGCP